MNDWTEPQFKVGRACGVPGCTTHIKPANGITREDTKDKIAEGCGCCEKTECAPNDSGEPGSFIEVRNIVHRERQDAFEKWYENLEERPKTETKDPDCDISDHDERIRRLRESIKSYRGIDDNGKPDSFIEARNIVHGERQDSYGNPEDSFRIIAQYWEIYIGQILNIPFFTFTARDVANMMILFKQARKLGQKHCRDNYIDSMGYEGIAADRLSGD